MLAALSPPCTDDARSVSSCFSAEGLGSGGTEPEATRLSGAGTHSARCGSGTGLSNLPGGSAGLEGRASAPRLASATPRRQDIR